MSEYYERLDSEAKARYKKKLELAGLALEDDPYAPVNQEKFKDDMAAWPPLEYGHIFGYFIRRPGLYTQEQLLSWKQLDAFNYFQNGYVPTMYIQKLKNGSSVLKALVNPSQRTPDKAHHPWIIVKEDATVVAAHCTCMAGYCERVVHAGSSVA